MDVARGHVRYTLLYLVNIKGCWKFNISNAKHVLERLLSIVEWDQVSRGVSVGVLRRHATTVANALKKPVATVQKLNSVIRSSYVTRSQVVVISDQWRLSLWNIMVHSGEGDFILFDKIPVSTRQLHQIPFKTFMYEKSM